MTGELLSFMIFVCLMLLLIGWLLRRGARAVDKLDAEIEELRKRPPVRLAGAVMLAAFLMVAAGTILYATGSIGWAQWCWVVASGTAGAGVVLLVEERPK